MNLKTTFNCVIIILFSILNVTAQNDEETVKEAIKNVYYVFFTKMDKDEYRTLLMKDYLLLENGEILNIDGDIGLMPTKEDEYKRTDRFDFQKVTIEGNVAYAVYLLKSDIKDKKNGTRKREWLESAVLIRTNEGWKMSLLHSTRIKDK